MENYMSNMPAWAIVLFVASFLLSLGLIVRPAKQAALAAGLPVEKSRNIQFGILLFYLLWLGYTSILSLKGVFHANVLPPRVIVLTTIPLTVILFAFIGNTGLYKRLLRSATLESLVFMHVFRVVGVFFFVLSHYRLLEPGFAFASGLGDLLTAVLAIPVARAVSLQKPWSRKAVFGWNILGILDIVVLMTIAMVTAIRSVGAVSPPDSEMTVFPFVWFPAFAPATILFLHYTVFRKLRQQYEPLPSR